MTELPGPEDLTSEVLEALRGVTMGNLGWQVTDVELTVAWRDPRIRAMAAVHGWSDSELRDKLCGVLEVRHGATPPVCRVDLSPFHDRALAVMRLAQQLVSQGAEEWGPPAIEAVIATVHACEAFLTDMREPLVSLERHGQFSWARPRLCRARVSIEDAVVGIGLAVPVESVGQGGAVVPGPAAGALGQALRAAACDMVVLAVAVGSQAFTSTDLAGFARAWEILLVGVGDLLLAAKDTVARSYQHANALMLEQVGGRVLRAADELRRLSLSATVVTGSRRFMSRPGAVDTMRHRVRGARDELARCLRGRWTDREVWRARLGSPEMASLTARALRVVEAAVGEMAHHALARLGVGAGSTKRFADAQSLLVLAGAAVSLCEETRTTTRDHDADRRSVEGEPAWVVDNCAAMVWLGDALVDGYARRCALEVAYGVEQEVWCGLLRDLSSLLRVIAHVIEMLARSGRGPAASVVDDVLGTIPDVVRRQIVVALEEHADQVLVGPGDDRGTHRLGARGPDWKGTVMMTNPAEVGASPGWLGPLQERASEVWSTAGCLVELMRPGSTESSSDAAAMTLDDCRTMLSAMSSELVQLERDVRFAWAWPDVCRARAKIDEALWVIPNAILSSAMQGSRPDVARDAAATRFSSAARAFGQAVSERGEVLRASAERVSVAPADLAGFVSVLGRAVAGVARVVSGVERSGPERGWMSAERLFLRVLGQAVLDAAQTLRRVTVSDAPAGRRGPVIRSGDTVATLRTCVVAAEAALAGCARDRRVNRAALAGSLARVLHAVDAIVMEIAASEDTPSQPGPLDGLAAVHELIRRAGAAVAVCASLRRVEVDARFVANVGAGATAGEWRALQQLAAALGDGTAREFGSRLARSEPELVVAVALNEITGLVDMIDQVLRVPVLCGTGLASQMADVMLDGAAREYVRPALEGLRKQTVGLLAAAAGPRWPAGRGDDEMETPAAWSREG